MDKNEFLEAEVRWLLSLPDDEPIVAYVSKVIVLDLLEQLKEECEKKGSKSPLLTRSRAPRHIPVSVVESEDEV